MLSDPELLREFPVLFERAVSHDDESRSTLGRSAFAGSLARGTLSCVFTGILTRQCTAHDRECLDQVPESFYVVLSAHAHDELSVLREKLCKAFLLIPQRSFAGTGRILRDPHRIVQGKRPVTSVIFPDLFLHLAAAAGDEIRLSAEHTDLLRVVEVLVAAQPADHLVIRPGVAVHEVGRLSEAVSDVRAEALLQRFQRADPPKQIDCLSDFPLLHGQVQVHDGKARDVISDVGVVEDRRRDVKVWRQQPRRRDADPLEPSLMQHRGDEEELLLILFCTQLRH